MLKIPPKISVEESGREEKIKEKDECRIPLIRGAKKEGAEERERERENGSYSFGDEGKERFSFRFISIPSLPSYSFPMNCSGKIVCEKGGEDRRHTDSNS